MPSTNDISRRYNPINYAMATTVDIERDATPTIIVASLQAHVT